MSRENRTSTVNALIQWVARRARGPSYRIDNRLPLGALLGYAFRRAVWALRGSCKLLLVQFRFRTVFMAAGVELRNAHLISIGRSVVLDRGVFIDGLSLDGVTLGNNVTVGRYSVIRATGVLSKVG